MRDPVRESKSASKSSNDVREVPAPAGRGANWVENLTFEALLQDEVIRLVMASDRVSESELRTLREIHPLIA